MNERLGLQPQLAHSYRAYGCWMLGRADGRSRKIGRDLQARALALAEALGMSWLAAAARASE